MEWGLHAVGCQKISMLASDLWGSKSLCLPLNGRWNYFIQIREFFPVVMAAAFYGRNCRGKKTSGQ